jgi:hypothetical protein
MFYSDRNQIFILGEILLLQLFFMFFNIFFSKKPLEISLGIYKDGCIAILLHKLTHEVEPMMVVYSCIGKIYLVTNTSFNVVFL